METGKVQLAHEGCYAVIGAMGLIHARRAAGCLLEPLPGDTVLILLTARQSYVLHVLERSGDEGSLVLPPKTTVRPEGGESVLCLSADAVIVEGNRLDLRAETLTAKAGTLSFAAAAMRFAGRTLTRRFESAYGLFTHLYENARRKVGQYGNHIRQVDELDETRAGRMRTTVNDSLRVRSGSASLRTRGTLDMDGKHINIG